MIHKRYLPFVLFGAIVFVTAIVFFSKTPWREHIPGKEHSDQVEELAVIKRLQQPAATVVASQDLDTTKNDTKPSPPLTIGALITGVEKSKPTDNVAAANRTHAIRAALNDFVLLYSSEERDPKSTTNIQERQELEEMLLKRDQNSY